LPCRGRFGRRPPGKAGSGRQCSIAPVNRRLAFLTGGVALGVAAVWRAVRRKPRPVAESDPRAEQLRARLDESRAVVDDREEFEGAETTVDAVEAVPEPEERRRAVHAEGRAVVDKMRGSKQK
jgi:hypothetical protein